MFIPSLIVIIGFIIVHIFTRHFSFLNRRSQNVLMSVFSGGSVAYVFLHLVPELNHYGEVIQKASFPLGIERLDYPSYLIALTGIAVFYGIDKLNVKSQDQNEEQKNQTRPSGSVFTLNISVFAFYNILIGYLLPQLSGENLLAYLMYWIVFSFHFIANNRILHLTHEELYTKAGRWILAVSVFLGWLWTQLTETNELVTAFAASFLIGGVILNIMNNELPDHRNNSFLAFVGGLLIVIVLLQII